MNIFRIIGREHKKTLTLTLNALWAGGDCPICRADSAESWGEKLNW